MFNPQKQNGHFAIANEMAEALARTSLAPNEARVLWVVWRKTYGWHKGEDAISLSQFRSLTWLQKPHIIRSLHSLERRKILVVTRTGNKNTPNMYRFNQNYDQWVVAAAGNNSYAGQEQKVVAASGNDDVLTAPGNKLLPAPVPTKDTITKDTNNKDRKEIYKEKTESSTKREANKELREHSKKEYGEFKNVRLTDEEYARLTERFTDALDRIESLSAYKKSRNKHYADDYATILNWSRRDNDSIKQTRRGDIPDYANYQYENPPL